MSRSREEEEEEYSEEEEEEDTSEEYKPVILTSLPERKVGYRLIHNKVVFQKLDIVRDV